MYLYISELVHEKHNIWLCLFWFAILSHLEINTTAEVIHIIVLANVLTTF